MSKCLKSCEKNKENNNNNKINKIDVYLEARLQEWSEWLTIGNELNIGYHSRSSIAMFADGKISNQKNNYSPKSISVNEHAEEIESMIVDLAKYKPIMADCLRYHYLNQASLRVSAKKLNISYTHYKFYIQMAKQWLVGRMG